MAQDFQLLSSEKCFEGQQNSYSFFSKELQSVTKFCAFIPANVTKENPAPVLYFLSGVTYNEQSVFLLSGIQRYAAECNLIIVSPDTSPRGCNIPGEDDREDFGTGVGFYVDATTEGYKNHYRMYSFVVHELPAVVNEHLPAIHGLMSLCGHSMGGHGALICGLKNPGLFKSVSAFAAVSNPSGSPWGRRCYKGYLGDDEEEWKKYNATNLVATYTGPELYIRIDQVKSFYHCIVLTHFIFRALKINTYNI